MSETDTQRREAYLVDVAEKCLWVSAELARKAEKDGLTRNVIRVLNLTFGFIAALVTLSPDVRTYLGEGPSAFVSLGSAALLLLGTLYFMFIGTNPPERFRDYAQYIRHYNDQILLLMARSRDTMTDAKLDVLAELAMKNIADASTRWPFSDPSGMPVRRVVAPVSGSAPASPHPNLES